MNNILDAAPKITGLMTFQKRLSVLGADVSNLNDVFLEMFFIAVIGFMVGGMINIYAFHGSQRKNALLDYLAFYYKDIKYVGVELLCILALMLLYAKWGLNGQFIGNSVLLFFLIAAAAVDIQKKIIPNKLILTGSAAGVLMLPVNDRVTWLSALLAVLLIGGMLWIVAVISKGGFGLGDVKLLGCIGLFLGLEQTLSALVLSLLLSAAWGLVLITVKRSNKNKQIPFAPFVLVGTFMAILL